MDEPSQKFQSVETMADEGDCFEHGPLKSMFNEHSFGEGCDSADLIVGGNISDLTLQNHQLLYCSKEKLVFWIQRFQQELKRLTGENKRLLEEKIQTEAINKQLTDMLVSAHQYQTKESDSFVQRVEEMVALAIGTFSTQKYQPSISRKEHNQKQLLQSVNDETFRKLSYLKASAAESHAMAQLSSSSTIFAKSGEKSPNPLRHNISVQKLLSRSSQKSLYKGQIGKRSESKEKIIKSFQKKDAIKTEVSEIEYDKENDMRLNNRCHRKSSRIKERPINPTQMKGLNSSRLPVLTSVDGTKDKRKTDYKHGSSKRLEDRLMSRMRI